jgi:high-affinity Fe2+/Pb2+ permease
VTGLDVLIIAVALLFLLATWHYSHWQRWDEYRRAMRKVQRDLAAEECGQ